jgi:acyl carrier protein
MNAIERERWLRSLISKISGNSAAGIGVHDDLQQMLGLDSLGRLEVLAEIEDQFDFYFEDNETMNASTLSKILEAIDRKLREVKGAEA